LRRTDIAEIRYWNPATGIPAEVAATIFGALSAVAPLAQWPAATLDGTVAFIADSAGFNLGEHDQ
jgi:hypothetical protein